MPVEWLEDVHREINVPKFVRERVTREMGACFGLTSYFRMYFEALTGESP